MSRLLTSRPLVVARRAAIAAADNLSVALACEGLPDGRAATALNDAEACLKEALRLIEAARGPVPPVPPAVAAVADRAAVVNMMHDIARGPHMRESA